MLKPRVLAQTTRRQPCGTLKLSVHTQGVICRASSSTNPHTKKAAHDVKPGHEEGKGFETKHKDGSHHRDPHHASGTGARFLQWLQDNGVPEQAVTLKSIEPAAVHSSPDAPAEGALAGPVKRGNSPAHSRPIDMVVAKRHLKAGEVALRVPEPMVICLERVFESEFVAELLTTDKLSELACLTLYLMYEKKVGEESFWYPYIKELDRQRARGAQAVESPLLWEASELEELLQGSPLLLAVKQRLQGIRKEYEQLDTVWYMSQSLFNKYPFDLPTETFSFERFKQAFSAVQSCIVHLQGVPPARRFTLVPLGPPLLSYSSTSKALLAWDPASRSVQLVVDRDFDAGEPVTAWCGPQPNSRLLLNYGIVDEHNPYDKLQMTAVLGSNDPLYQSKRLVLQAAGLSTSQSFDLGRNKPLPPLLLPYMRLAAATSQQEVQQVSFQGAGQPLAADKEAAIRSHLISHLQQRIKAYRHTMEEDSAIIADARSTPRQQAAARLTKIEKGILLSALEQLGGSPAGAANSAAALPYLKLS